MDHSNHTAHASSPDQGYISADTNECTWDPGSYYGAHLDFYRSYFKRVHTASKITTDVGPVIHLLLNQACLN